MCSVSKFWLAAADDIGGGRGNWWLETFQNRNQDAWNVSHIYLLKQSWFRQRSRSSRRTVSAPETRFPLLLFPVAEPHAGVYRISKFKTLIANHGFLITIIIPSYLIYALTLGPVAALNHRQIQPPSKILILGERLLKHGSNYSHCIVIKKHVHSQTSDASNLTRT